MDEIARWQQAIYELCKKHKPDVDGAGSDGDELDLTLSEINEVFIMYQDRIDDLQKTVYEYENELGFLPEDVSVQEYVAYSNKTINKLLDVLWPFVKAHQECEKWYNALDMIGEQDLINARKVYSGIRGE